MFETRLRYARVWIAGGWVLIGAVVLLSLVPSPPDPFDNTSDKIKHAAAYAMLMGWFVQIYSGLRARALLAVGFITLGALLEVLQSFSPVRHFDVADMAANSVGVVSAWLVIGWSPLSRALHAVERKLFHSR